MEDSRKLPHVRICICALLIFLSVLGCEKERQKTQAPPSTRGDEVLAATTLLSTVEAQEKPEGLDPSSGENPPLVVVFNARGRGVAYVAQKEGMLHIVHNGKAGRPITGMDQMVIGPDGQRIAYGAMVDGKWRMVIDDGVGVDSDEVGEPVFSPDSLHIAYSARIGDKWRMVVDNRMSEGVRSFDGKPLFSADAKKVAYVEQVGENGALRLVVSDLEFKTRNVKESTGALVVSNRDNTRMAAVRQGKNKQRVIQFSFDRPDAVTEGPQYDSISNLVFGADGVSVAYIAERGGKRFLALNGKEERLPDGAPAGPPVVRPDNNGVGVILNSAAGFVLHQAFFNDGSKNKASDEAADLVYSSDSSLYAYVARKGDAWFVVVNGKEGPAFDRVVTPMFSPDGSRLVYRARQDGKRFVVVADANGKVIRQHPAYEQVFPVAFTADGKSVAYGVKDGNKLIWKVEKL